MTGNSVRAKHNEGIRSDIAVSERAIIVSAPSGAGKTSLANALVEMDPLTVLSISHTTRGIRSGEVDGVDYHFVSKSVFNTMIEADRFLEYACVFDHLYGTSRDAVDGGLAKGLNILLDIDWQGARKVRAAMPASLSVFILPPSRVVLERRLRGRGSDSETVIDRRMRDAASEAAHFKEYDFVIINDEFDASVAELAAVVQGKPHSRTPDDPEVQRLVNELSTTIST